MLKESTKLSINQKRDITLVNFYQKASKNQHFQGVIYLIDSRYSTLNLLLITIFRKLNVLKNDVAGKKIEIHGNENSLIAISNKYSVNFA